MTRYFGNTQSDEEEPVGKAQGQIAALIWGHRLRSGQSWIEYLLEFLNVVVGFDYHLGRGGNGEKYRYATRIGLRRFVFCDPTQSTHPEDEEARKRLVSQLRAAMQDDPDSALGLSKQLLHSLTVVEKDRSWYAKALFPVHQDLLFFEAYRPKATSRASMEAEAKPPYELDEDVRYDARNFFCRGGEVYYLCLSAAAEDDPEKGRRVMNRLKVLLQDRNKEIGQLAAYIDGTWNDVASHPSPKNRDFALGYIPSQGRRLYKLMLDDVDQLLAANLDPLESLSLLAHLLCFHVILYIYFHTERIGGETEDPPLPKVLVDCTDDGGAGIRMASSSLLRQRHKSQEAAVSAFVTGRVMSWLSRQNPSTRVFDDLTGDLLDELKLKPNKNKRQSILIAIDTCSEKFAKGQVTRERFAKQVSEVLVAELIGDFRKNFGGIHRKLAREIGFVLPRGTGSFPRYVLTDNLLRTLVIANYEPGLTFHEFLDRLYGRYGIVVGSEQAAQAGFRQLRISSDSYSKNEASLLARMNQTGLVVQYSDSTAMVKGIGHD